MFYLVIRSFAILKVSKLNFETEMYPSCDDVLNSFQAGSKKNR